MAIFGNRNNIENNDAQVDSKVTPIAPDTSERVIVTQESRPIDPVSPDKSETSSNRGNGGKIQDVHDIYKERENDSDIGWFAINNGQDFVKAYNGVKYVVDQTAFGDALNATMNNVRGIINDVQALAKDPRYAVYYGMRLLKDAITGGIDIEDRIKSNQNPNMVDPTLANQIASMSQFDPTGGILTAAAAKKLQTQLSKSYKYDTRAGTILADNNDKVLGARNRASSRNSDQSLKDPDRQFGSYNTLVESPMTLAKRRDSDFKNYGPNTLSAVRITDVKPSMNGYKTVQGLTIGSRYLWDITLTNYWCKDDSGKVLPTYAPMVPRPYTPLDNKFSKVNFIPAISYSFNDYSPLTNDIELLNGSSTNYVSGYKKDNKLTITFLDDEEFTWTRFFDNYFKSVYDIRNNCVAPYKQTCLMVRLYNYSPGQNAYFYHELIVIPSGFSMVNEGEDGIDAYDFDVEFSVVGDENNPEYEEFE